VHYRSVEQLNRLVSSWVSAGGAEPYDVVVGIPRSGMLAGSLIALAAHLPLTDLRSAGAGLPPQGGLRSPRAESGAQRLLVVDDTVNSGANMQLVRQQLAASPHVDLAAVTTMAAFASPRGRRHVDLCLETVDWPRVFEWNVLHQPEVLAGACVDADGLLWPAPAAAGPCDSSGPGQTGWPGQEGAGAVSTGAGGYRPSARVGVVVALEPPGGVAEVRARLAERGVDAAEVVVVAAPAADAVGACCGTVAAKSRLYRERQATLYYCSAYCRAVGIANGSGRPVYWTTGARMVYPGSTPSRPCLAPRRREQLRWQAERVWRGVRRRAVDRLPARLLTR
jgi:orotate phosphoribosyltransferase